MSFLRVEPEPSVNHLVECYWFVDDKDTSPIEQKIIPDGYPEIIFHYGDPYEINLGDRWELQGPELIAGQLTRFFFLRNTGRSGIAGIKLKPTAPAHLFNVQMHTLTDVVANLNTTVPGKFDSLKQIIHQQPGTDNLVDAFNTFFRDITACTKPSVVDPIVNRIIQMKGAVTITELCEHFATSERQLERQFRQYVGLSPKFFSRVIRFSTIFHSMKDPDLTWTDRSLEAGYYDQPHFIKNFKTFTGEEPTRYLFGKENLANFFLKKP